MYPYQADLKAWYARTKEKTKIQGALSIQRIKTANDWPKLKVKAAPTRHLVPYALFLCTEYGGADPHSLRRRAACQLLQNIYDIFAQHERWFPPDVQDQLATASRAFMKAYLQLSAEAVRAEKKL